MRAAFVLTGHLRDTCESRAGISVVERHLDACRAAFDGRCDFFLYTWDRLDKGPEFPGGAPVQFPGGNNRCSPLCQQTMHQHNTSAWSCVSNLSATLAPAAVAVESQDRLQDDDTPWVNQSLRGFRMNTAAMLGGLDLMTRHAAAMGHTYDAVVRLRADVGCRKMRGRPEFREQFIDTDGWQRVRKKAAAVHNNSAELAPHLRSQIELCDRPRKKRIDFCFWSAPPEPLLRTVESLRGDELDRLARNVSTNMSSPDWLVHLPVGGLAPASSLPDSARYLDRRHMPLFVENLLFCAARARGVRWPPCVV